MIDIQNITIAHRGGRTLLDSASARVSAGSMCALIGRNGSGKSSLLRVLAGMDRPKSGSVLVDGVDVHSSSPSVLARKLAIVTTERIRVSNLTCRSVVSLGRAPYTGGFGTLSPKDHEAVEDALRLTDTLELASRSITTLSDGEAQRVMLARALAQDTPVILLDEPTSFLDVPNRRKLTDLLATLCHDRGRTIIYSTHELELAFSRSDSVMLLEDKCLTLLPAGEMKSRFDENPWI